MKAGSASLLLCVAPALLALFAPVAVRAAESADIAQSRKALAEARTAAEDARRRGEKLEADAAAALAARIQQAQAQIIADEATIHIIANQQAGLRDSLATRQWPLLRLTAALQRLARRPLALAVMQPGSVIDAAHLRAVLGSTMPEVRRRTADLRQQLAAARALHQQAVRAQGALRTEQSLLSARQNALTTLVARQRMAASASAGGADRETERANALAEQARDLAELVGSLEQAAGLRERLALLPGPLIRPPRPGESEVMTVAAPMPEASAPAGYVLPVAGRLVTGFGDGAAGGAASRGLTIAAAPGAQVVAPAAGRVSFAGPYRGFGSIVILDHAGGWTSLVTGLGSVDVRVGDMLVGGAPLGVVAAPAAGGTQTVGSQAAGGLANLTLELRHNGQPVNPLEQMRLP